LQTTTVYVTHDQVEAMTMGDRIAVMKDGILQQVDTPHMLFTNPTNVFVAGFIGSPAMNLLTMNVEQGEDGVYMTSQGTAGEDTGMRVRVPNRFKDFIAPYAGKQLIFGLRPQDIHDARFAQGMLDEDESPEDLAPVRTRVDVVEPMGSEVYLYLLNGQHSIISRVDDRTTVQPGYVLDVAFNMDKMHAFDPETTESVIDKEKAKQ
jgi:multiple sugar transport system ATP-binding protein